jgi:peroxiredoxin
MKSLRLQRPSRLSLYGGASAVAAFSIAVAAINARWSGGLLPPSQAEIGRRAPDFCLRPADATAMALCLSELRGRPVVLLFTCGCVMCCRFTSLLADVESQLPGAQLLGISTNVWMNRSDNLAVFRKRGRFHWPMLVDPDLRTAAAYRSLICPRVWLVDASGNVRYCSNDRVHEARTMLRELLSEYRVLTRKSMGREEESLLSEADSRHVRIQRSFSACLRNRWH